MTSPEDRILEVGRDFRPVHLHKLIRARMISHELAGAYYEYRRSLGVESSVSYAADGRSATVAAMLAEPPPVDYFASLAGDALHNYRSALDGFIWDLAHLNGATPPKPKQLYFPIFTDRAQWEAARGSVLSSIPAEILERLSWVQPFTVLPADEGIGVLLHQLDISDKHRGELTLRLRARDKVTFAIRHRHATEQPIPYVWLAGDDPIFNGQEILRLSSRRSVGEVSVDKLPLVLEIVVEPQVAHPLFHFLEMVDSQVARTFEIVSTGGAETSEGEWLNGVGIAVPPPYEPAIPLKDE